MRMVSSASTWRGPGDGVIDHPALGGAHKQKPRAMHFSSHHRSGLTQVCAVQTAAGVSA